MRRSEAGGWVDYYIGAVRDDSRQRRSLLDPTAHIGLHYLKADWAAIRKMEPPEGVPPYLWRSLVDSPPAEMRERWGMHVPLKARSRVR
jgi:hypothetical protein